jgi:hypothetical protein
MTRLKVSREALERMAELPQAALPTPELNITRCILAMTMAGSEADEEKGEDPRAFARAAYMSNMPPLSDRESIQANIACIANGIALGVIDGKEGSQMLYAAQVAISAHRTEKKETRKPAWQKTKPKPAKATPQSTNANARGSAPRSATRAKNSGTRLHSRRR